MAGLDGWVTCQERLNFGIKRTGRIRDKTGCNGLGNRCSIREVSDAIGRFRLCFLDGRYTHTFKRWVSLCSISASDIRPPVPAGFDPRV